jgi:3-keto-5-aminohexanoate cleavage enzyme
MAEKTLRKRGTSMKNEKKTSSPDGKLIITAAITGSRIMRDTAPYIPYTPEEIVQSAVECWRAGASIAHIHVRDLKTGLGAQDLELFRRVAAPLREQTDLVLSLTTSGIAGRNLPIQDRLTPLELVPELASFDAGSINLGGGVFSNPPEFLDAAAEMMMAKGVKPEIEIFDSGMIVTALRMRDEGKILDPMHFQFVLGTPWGAPATPKSLLFLLEHIPADATWSVIGIGKNHLPIAMMGLIMGGHVRVGMEDNIYYQRGVLAKSNAQFVERIVRIAAEYGREVASPHETRLLLGLARGLHAKPGTGETNGLKRPD